jgi:hypothetical protein
VSGGLDRSKNSAGGQGDARAEAREVLGRDRPRRVRNPRGHLRLRRDAPGKPPLGADPSAELVRVFGLYFKRVEDNSGFIGWHPAGSASSAPVFSSCAATTARGAVSSTIGPARSRPPRLRWRSVALDRAGRAIRRMKHPDAVHYRRTEEGAKRLRLGIGRRT